MLDLTDIVDAIEGGGSEFANEYLEQLRAWAESGKRASQGRLPCGRNAAGNQVFFSHVGRGYGAKWK